MRYNLWNVPTWHGITPEQPQMRSPVLGSSTEQAPTVAAFPAVFPITSLPRFGNILAGGGTIEFGQGPLTAAAIGGVLSE